MSSYFDFNGGRALIIAHPPPLGRPEPVGPEVSLLTLARPPAPRASFLRISDDSFGRLRCLGLSAESVSASLKPDFSLRRTPKRRSKTHWHTVMKGNCVEIDSVCVDNASLVLFVAPCKLITWILFIGFRNCEARGSQQYPHQHEEFKSRSNHQDSWWRWRQLALS